MWLAPSQLPTPPPIRHPCLSCYCGCASPVCCLQIQQLEGSLKETAVFATNTSALPIADVAKAAKRPENVVGMHYFSPVDKMPLLEVITHAGTSKEVRPVPIIVMTFPHSLTPVQPCLPAETSTGRGFRERRTHRRTGCTWCRRNPCHTDRSLPLCPGTDHDPPSVPGTVLGPVSFFSSLFLLDRVALFPSFVACEFPCLPLVCLRSPDCRHCRGCRLQAGQDGDRR